MTTNQDGHLLDDKGNVAIDFVWGNFPLQPNDVRRDNGGTNLDYTKDNHVIAEAGWNGYPLYVPNTVGSVDAGVAYITVPNVIGQLTADAVDTLTDAEFGTITTAGAVTPAITGVSLTSNVASVTSTGHGYAVGDVVTVAGFVNGSGSASADADLNGTHTITIVTDANNFAWAQTHGNITPHSGLTGVTAKVAAKAGRIKAQSVAAGASDIAVGTAITITPYFAS
jgi:hypothetical protein